MSPASLFSSFFSSSPLSTQKTATGAAASLPNDDGRRQGGIGGKEVIQPPARVLEEEDDHSGERARPPYLHVRHYVAFRIAEVDGCLLVLGDDSWWGRGKYW